MKRWLGLILSGGLALAQQPAPAPPAPLPALTQAEERDLNTAIAEAGSSPLEFMRALEQHLQKYPNSPRRKEIERALAKSAVEVKDDKRLIQYGERVLAREPDDLQLLERVARALLSSDDKESSTRALGYAKHYEELVAGMRSHAAPGRESQAEWQEEIDKGQARALVLEARATGNLGRLDEAVALAQKSYDAYPSAESAREIARWLLKAGREREAIPRLAEAFSIEDARNTEAMRAKDRQRLGEVYRKLNGGSEKGLGDEILAAYDRTAGLLAARRLRLQQSDPNLQATSISEFTLSGLHGQKLPLASLKGKTVVFDFWATWCTPCRAQHPLYEEVKKRFHDSPDLVFLSVNADEDRGAVEPFVKQQGWSEPIYFEDGLSRILRIGSLPTTVILDKHGAVYSRLNGFLPDRFVDMLSERIRDAMKD